jgi:hypothetical protein
MQNKKLSLNERTKIVCHLKQLLEKTNFTPITIQQLSKNIKVDYKRIGVMLGYAANNCPLYKKMHPDDFKKLTTLFSKNHIPDIINKPSRKKKTVKKKGSKRKWVKVIFTSIESNRRKH